MVACIRSIFSLFIICLCSIVTCYLTPNDLNYLKTTILNMEDKKTGLFSSDSKLNLMAIEASKILKIQVDKKKICRELDIENPSPSDVLINQQLKCDLNLSLEKLSVNVGIENLENVKDFSELYEKVRLAKIIGSKLNPEDLLRIISTFETKNGLYSLRQTQTNSLSATFYAIRVFGIILSNNPSKEISKSTKVLLSKSLKETSLNIQQVTTTTGLFTELNVDTLKLNYIAVSAFSEISSYIKNDTLKDNIQSLILLIRNYYDTNKHLYVSLERIFHITKIYSLLNKWPILVFEKNTIIFDDKEKLLNFKVINLFGEEESRFNLKIDYNQKDNSKQESLSSDSDLPDDSEVNSSIKSVNIAQSSESFLNFNEIEKAGQYVYNLNVSFEDSKTGFKGTLNQELQVRSLSRVKINYLKITVVNGEQDSKEIKVENPKRIFKVFKAIQSSIIKIKINLNVEKIGRPEQFFLRLKHHELNKVATGFATSYDIKSNYHLINFDLSDHVSIYT